MHAPVAMESERHRQCAAHRRAKWAAEDVPGGPERGNEEALAREHLVPLLTVGDVIWPEQVATASDRIPEGESGDLLGHGPEEAARGKVLSPPGTLPVGMADQGGPLGLGVMDAVRSLFNGRPPKFLDDLRRRTLDLRRRFGG